MRTTSDLRAADAAAVRATVTLVASIKPSDLDLATPCADWDLRALLAHMTAQHHGFAASAAGRGRDETAWRSNPQQPLSRYGQSAAEVIAAFAPDDVPERMFAMPELGDRLVPGHLAIGFHLVDYVVHGWDVAATLGLPWELPPEVLAAALSIARAVPADGRDQPGAAFAPALPVPLDASPLTEILTLLGRSPSWRPESVGGPC